MVRLLFTGGLANGNRICVIASEMLIFMKEVFLMEELRFRQIHMDFHTSEKILSVGERFDGERFASTLEAARVNSVSCFARCHHGMMYYDSERFPEMVHPGLKNKNLLQEQIDACHKRGIRVPVYTTIQWDYHMSRMHPDWCCLTADGGSWISVEKRRARFMSLDFIVHFVSIIQSTGSF